MISCLLSGAGTGPRPAIGFSRPSLRRAAATERIAASRGLTLATLAAAVGISPRHMSDCRVGRRTPSDTLIVALRAAAAGAPPLPEERP